MLSALVSRVKGSEIVRGATVLASGTAVAQIVIIASAPILTRLFSPEQYGIMGVVVSIAALLAMVGTLSYDRALVLERDGESASHLLVLVLIWSTLLAVAASVGGPAIAQAFGAELAADYHHFLPWTGVLMLATVANMTLSMWTVRLKRYRAIATAEGLLAVAMVTVQLASGLLGVGVAGLLGGQLAGTVVATLFLGTLAYRNGAFAKLRNFNIRAQWALARKHYQFPLYATPTSLLERSSKRLPVFLLPLLFSPVEAGYYWLCYRVVTAPVRLIVLNSQKPYYKQALELQARGQPIAPLFWKSTAALLVFSIPMVVGVILLAPALFEIVFGESWQRAGQYAPWIAVATAASVLNLPGLQLAPIFQCQGQVLVFQIIHTVVRVLALVVGGLLGDDLLAIALFAISSCVMSVAMIGYFWRLIGTASQTRMPPMPLSVGQE